MLEFGFWAEEELETPNRRFTTRWFNKHMRENYDGLCRVRRGKIITHSRKVEGAKTREPVFIRGFYLEIYDFLSFRLATTNEHAAVVVALSFLMGVAEAVDPQKIEFWDELRKKYDRDHKHAILHFWEPDQKPS